MDSLPPLQYIFQPSVLVSPPNGVKKPMAFRQIKKTPYYI